MCSTVPSSPWKSQRAQGVGLDFNLALNLQPGAEQGSRTPDSPPPLLLTTSGHKEVVVEGGSNLTLASLIRHLLYAKKTQQAPLTPPGLPACRGEGAGGSPWPSPLTRPTKGGPAPAGLTSHLQGGTTQVSQGPSRRNCDWTHLVTKATQKGGSPASPALTSFRRWEETAQKPVGTHFPTCQFLPSARGRLGALRSVRSSTLTLTPSHGSQENPIFAWLKPTSAGNSTVLGSK